MRHPADAPTSLGQGRPFATVALRVYDGAMRVSFGHWRLIVALVPAMVLGTRVYDHLRLIGWGQALATLCQMSAAIIAGLLILGILARLWPARRDLRVLTGVRFASHPAAAARA